MRGLTKRGPGAGLVLAALLVAAVGPEWASATKHLHKDHPMPKGSQKSFPTHYEPEYKDFWYENAQEQLQEVLQQTVNTNVAKNVILFLGDGMGNPTITSARIYKGQTQKNSSGEEEQLVFETFPNVALSKTYCVNKQVADSACSGTAYLTGVKTNYRLLGLDAHVTAGDCTTITEDSKVFSIAKWALDAKKKAGFVTSTRVTHATPGATYAHTAHRDWECDAEITPEMHKDCPDFKDIARQLVEDEPGRSFNVIMGGGYQYLVSNATSRTGDPIDTTECYSTDGRDLFQKWQDDKKAAGVSYATARTKSELLALDLTDVDYLMGIYANLHVPWEYVKRQENLDIPTLAQMTAKAIQVLQGDEGFFLLVEGGRIDHAHHDTTARKALDETLAFDEAIATALGMVSTDDTLIVVTADHSHTMTVNGYAERGTDILGFAGLDDDDLPYTTLMYTNGVNFNFTTDKNGSVVRYNITEDDTTDFDYLQLAPVYRDSETHGGEDVGIYAIGPMAHLFTGVYEQNYIAHAMGYASCIGPNKYHCITSGSNYGGSASHPGLQGVMWGVTLIASLAVLYRQVAP